MYAYIQGYFNSEKYGLLFTKFAKNKQLILRKKILFLLLFDFACNWDRKSYSGSYAYYLNLYLNMHENDFWLFKLLILLPWTSFFFLTICPRRYTIRQQNEHKKFAFNTSSTKKKCHGRRLLRSCAICIPCPWLFGASLCPRCNHLIFSPDDKQTLSSSIAVFFYDWYGKLFL